jgi:hypothetical protein
MRGLFLSPGDFYAATVVERLGLGEEGLVRAGCACYTTAEEIERLIEGVSEIARPSQSPKSTVNVSPTNFGLWTWTYVLTALIKSASIPYAVLCKFGR